MDENQQIDILIARVRKIKEKAKHVKDKSVRQEALKLAKRIEELIERLKLAEQIEETIEELKRTDENTL